MSANTLAKQKDTLRKDGNHDVIVAYTPKGEPMSRVAFSKMIEERIALAEHGKKVSMVDFEKEISNWLA